MRRTIFGFLLMSGVVTLLSLRVGLQAAENDSGPRTFQSADEADEDDETYAPAPSYPSTPYPPAVPAPFSPPRSAAPPALDGVGPAPFAPRPHLPGGEGDEGDLVPIKQEKGAVHVHLSDGSHLVGKLDKDQPFKLKTAFGEASVPAELIAGMKFTDNRDKGEALLFLRNGDRLSGKVQMDKLQLAAAWGEVSVALDQVFAISSSAQLIRRRVTVRGTDGAVQVHFTYEELAPVSSPRTQSAPAYSAPVNDGPYPAAPPSSVPPPTLVPVAH